MKRISLALVSLLAFASSAFAQTSYNRFGPVNGVLVGDSSTYYTSAADSSDIRALWSGTCDITTFLRGDGACAAASITGQALTRTNDTNVTLTLGGSPSTALVNPASLTLGWTGQLSAARGGTGVSSLGNLTDVDDTNVTLTLGGTPTGALINSTSITAGWTGTLAVSRGGIGVGTLTGIAKGNGTSAFTAAASSDVIGTWTGTCNSTTFLRADGTCQTVGSGSGSVTSISQGTGISNSPNPITTTGTISVDQTFSPTWTGTHTWGGATAQRIVINSTAANGPYTTWQRNGTAFADIGNGQNCGGSFTADALCLAARTGNPVQMSAGGRTSPDFELTSAGAANVNLNANFTGNLIADPGGGTDELTVTSGSVTIQAPLSLTNTTALGGSAAFLLDNSNPWLIRDQSNSTTRFTFGLSGDFTATAALNGASLAISGSSATVNGQNVCLANGTNCPASSGPTTVYKASATDRSSTTALASDPDLVFTSAASAVYKVEFCLVFGGVTTGTQGIKFAFNRTTVGSDPGQWSGGSRVNAAGAAHSGISLGLGTGDTTGQVSFATISVGNQQDSVCGSGQLVTNGTSSYAIQWAQNSSSANATRLGQGSFIQYQRIN